MARDRFSRYVSLPSSRVQTPDGDVREMMELRETTIDPPPRSYTVTVEPGQDMFLLADELLGAENLWYVLADMNPETFYPLDLAAVDSLNIPPPTEAIVSRYRRT